MTHAPVSVYSGRVMHQRMAPRHRFQYSVYSILLDLDRLSEADRASPIFSINSFNILSFHEKDHGAADGSPVADWARERLAAHGLRERAQRVLLLCYPRILGTVFNPLSVYWVYDRDDELVAMIYEVRNTFGGRHAYVEPVRDGQIGPTGARQEREKTFYVSPFLPMTLRYRFRISEPGEHVGLRIFVSENDKTVFAAAFRGTRAPLTNGILLRALFRVPVLTVNVVAGIHFEALRLWLKGAPTFAKPVAPPST